MASPPVGGQGDPCLQLQEVTDDHLRAAPVALEDHPSRPHLHHNTERLQEVSILCSTVKSPTGALPSNICLNSWPSRREGGCQ